MKFTVEIGEKEKQTISYSFNKFWGNVKIKVNNKKVVSDFRLYSSTVSKIYNFEVGTFEKHTIQIEKIPPLIMAGFKSNIYKVYVDEELIKTYKD